jgi:hypothetical protein
LGLRQEKGYILNRRDKNIVILKKEISGIPHPFFLSSRLYLKGAAKNSISSKLSEVYLSKGGSLSPPKRQLDKPQIEDNPILSIDNLYPVD